MFPGWFIAVSLAALLLVAIVYLLIGVAIRRILPADHPMQSKLGAQGILAAAALTVRYLQWILIAIIVGGGILVTVLHS